MTLMRNNKHMNKKQKIVLVVGAILIFSAFNSLACPWRRYIYKNPGSN